jgi:hypothetical protein
LRIPLGIQTPSPECIERQVLHAVVQRMRQQRRNGSVKGWPDLGREDEAETIRRWGQKVGYIDDPPSREAGPWREWLSNDWTRPPGPAGPGGRRHRRALDRVIPWWVARPQSPPPFHSAG